MKGTLQDSPIQITLNEQNIFTKLGWVLAIHPPGKKNDLKMFYQVNHHANLAHAKAVLAFTPSYPIDCVPINNMAKADYDDLESFWWMDVYTKEAVNEGCEVLAYCTWSITDLLSWLNGYQKRYGFIYVDRQEKEGASMTPS